MTRVIFRIDDVCAHTAPAELETLYAGCWARGWPLCFSVIPHTAYRFSPQGPIPADPLPITANPALVEFLGRLVRDGLAEIALHGWAHHHGEWATGDAPITRGLDLLRSTWPGAAIRVAVPPHDYVSSPGLAALRAAGLDLCTTWAAAHGGTRAAHWWGRLRRWVGVPFGRVSADVWTTDVRLLDFDGPPVHDWPVTRRLLRGAARRRIPLVLTQHPWHIAADAGRRTRWDRWQEQLAVLDDVQVVTYHG